MNSRKLRRQEGRRGHSHVAAIVVALDGLLRLLDVGIDFHHLVDLMSWFDWLTGGRCWVRFEWK